MYPVCTAYGCGLTSLSLEHLVILLRPNSGTQGLEALMNQPTRGAVLAGCDLNEKASTNVSAAVSSAVRPGALAPSAEAPHAATITRPTTPALSSVEHGISWLLSFQRGCPRLGESSFRLTRNRHAACARPARMSRRPHCTRAATILSPATARALGPEQVRAGG